MCNMPQTKKKSWIPENGCPVRKKCMEVIPFTDSGVNMFGPEHKRHATLFTCFYSSAIGIKLTNTIDADSFIMGICIFQVRKGAINMATNFLGPNNKLQKALKDIDNDLLNFENVLRGNIFN